MDGASRNHRTVQLGAEEANGPAKDPVPGFNFHRCGPNCRSRRTLQARRPLSLDCHCRPQATCTRRRGITLSLLDSTPTLPVILYLRYLRWVEL
jgi:hypothetical protein